MYWRNIHVKHLHKQIKLEYEYYKKINFIKA